MLAPLHTTSSPFADQVPRVDASGTTLGRAVSSWSTSTPTGSVTIACASRRSRASAPTSPRRTCEADPLPAAARRAAGPGSAPAYAADRVTLDGVTVRLRAGTEQVVTVNRTSGWHARVTFWSRTDDGWTERFQAGDGRIGYSGLVPAGSACRVGQAPLGTFRLPWAFGMHRQRDAWDPSYRKVRRGDYWVLDNRSDHYNRCRNKGQGRSAGGSRPPTRTVGAAEGLPASVRVGGHDQLQQQAGQAPRRRDLPPRQRRRGDRRLRERAPVVPAAHLNRLDQDRVPMIAIGR